MEDAFAKGPDVREAQGTVNVVHVKLLTQNAHEDEDVVAEGHTRVQCTLRVEVVVLEVDRVYNGSSEKGYQTNRRGLGVTPPTHRGICVCTERRDREHKHVL